MNKREPIANDPMETRLIQFAVTVNKVALIIMIIILAAGIMLGIAASAGDLLTFASAILPSAVLTLLVWLAKELVCLWLEYTAEMHCYARTQTEILLENSEQN